MLKKYKGVKSRAMQMAYFIDGEGIVFFLPLSEDGSVNLDAEVQFADPMQFQGTRDRIMDGVVRKMLEHGEYVSELFPELYVEIEINVGDETPVHSFKAALSVNDEPHELHVWIDNQLVQVGDKWLPGAVLMDSGDFAGSDMIADMIGVAINEGEEEFGVFTLENPGRLVEWSLHEDVRNFLKGGAASLPEGTRIRTEDGYVLRKSKSEWTDGDMTFNEALDGMDVLYTVL